MGFDQLVRVVGLSFQERDLGLWGGVGAREGREEREARGERLETGVGARAGRGRESERVQ